MSDGLDTSVVLRLLIGTPPDAAEVARAFVAGATTSVFVSDLVVSETYYALKHHYKIPHAEAVSALNALLADARVQSSGVAKSVLAAMSSRTETRSTPGLLDRLIHADYARDDVRLSTFDRELSRLAGANLLG